jgi:outer membrane lipoprotein-sorting protein
MKKLIFIMAGLIIMSVISAQTLDEIVKKYTAANKLDQVSNLQTIKITANMSMMGMEMPMVMWMKNPNKIKSVTTFNGQEMIQAFDGEKGYVVSPMTGSTEPVEMTEDQVKQTLRSSMFQNYMANYFKNGQLALAGEDKVNDKPAYKIKATAEGGTVIDMYIDKSSYLLVKTSTTTSQGGMTVTMDSYPSDYKETSGLLVPMKTTSSAQGMDIVINFTKVEVNLPMDDSLFKVKK